MTTHIQALILSKDYFNRRQAESYIRRHKQYLPLKMDEKLRTYRLRVPDETRYEYKIKPFTDGVKAIIGTPIIQMY